MQGRYIGSRFTFSAQGRFIGDQFEDDLNTLRLDRFFTVDALVSHEVTKGVSIFAACENLLNQRYVVGKTPVDTLGSPLQARVGLRLSFSRKN
jgi:outer membrane receptor protein involved in Fe transport